MNSESSDFTLKATIKSQKSSRSASDQSVLESGKKF